MAATPTFVIVGANLAGGRAAEALRKEGFGGRVVLIGAEPDPPYERPPLSKEYLRGEEERDKLFILPQQFYPENDVDLRLGTAATALDVRERTVELDKGVPVKYDKLLIATGGRVRRLAVPGSDLEGVYYLRTVADSERIAAEMAPGRRLVVAGAGFIGAEVAASARVKGLEVAVVEMETVPLKHALGEEVGRVYADIHRDQGVDLRLGEPVARFEGSRRVERVVCASGDAIDCDFVVVGVGIEPETSLAEAAGIEVGNGIVVNEYCETSVPDVYAAGDVANHYNALLGERLRVEHWQNAQNQGAAAAVSMLRRETFAEVPWFWSDQYDLNMQYAGYASTWDEVVFRGSVEERRFTAFYLRDGRIRAAMAIGRARDIRPARELIGRGVGVGAAALRDEEVDLRSLVPD
ncbi:MAG: FAD-dependent oxidoreductase [Chloroflexi bacterium]|nr:FAD-dependent oxidoreductase [Chloroflexota bacterium]